MHPDVSIAKLPVTAKDNGRYLAKAELRTLTCHAFLPTLVISGVLPLGMPALHCPTVPRNTSCNDQVSKAASARAKQLGLAASALGPSAKAWQY